MNPPLKHLSTPSDALDFLKSGELGETAVYHVGNLLSPVAPVKRSVAKLLMQYARCKRVYLTQSRSLPGTYIYRVTLPKDKRYRIGGDA